MLLPKFRAIGVNVKQKSLVSQCYSQITALDKEFDLTDYMTKPVQKNSELKLSRFRTNLKFFW